MEDNGQPAFPWGFLSEPDGPDSDRAATWIFRQLGAKAYKGFLETGPGLLVGPFFTDDNDVSLTGAEAIGRRANRELVGIAVMYLPVRSANFDRLVTDDTLRQTIYNLLARYDPETQSVILLRLDDTPLSVRIIGVAGEPSDQPTPKAAYHRDLLNRATSAGLPN